MSYEDSEVSVHDAKPVELFRFLGTYANFFYTSGPVEVEFGGDTYLPIAIKRSDVRTGTQDDDNLDLTVEMPVSVQMVKTYAFSTAPPQLDLTIFRYHRGAPGDFVAYWIGPVNNIQVSGGRATLRSPSALAHALVGAVPSVYYQSPCNHVLGDARCKVDLELLSFTTPGVEGPTNGPTDIWVDDIGTLAGMLIGGEVRLASGERRMISSYDAAAGPDPHHIVINFPFAQYIYDEDEVTLTPGCNHAYTGDCLNLYNNQVNFGGFPFIPDENIFQQGMEPGKVIPDNTCLPVCVPGGEEPCFDIYLDFQTGTYTLDGAAVDLSDILVGSGGDNDFNNFLVGEIGIVVTAIDLEFISQTTGFSVTPMVTALIAQGHTVVFELEMYAINYIPANPLDQGRVFFSWGTYGTTGGFYGTPNFVVGMGQFDIGENSYTPGEAMANVVGYTEGGDTPDIGVTETLNMISDFTFRVAANLTIDEDSVSLNGTGIYQVDPPTHVGVEAFEGAGLFLLMSNPEEAPPTPDDGFKVVIRKLRIVPPQGANVLNMSAGAGPLDCGGASRKLTAILLHGEPTTGVGEIGPQGGTMNIIGFNAAVIEAAYPDLFAMAATINEGFAEIDFDGGYFPDGVSISDPIGDLTTALLDPDNFVAASSLTYFASGKYYMTNTHARWEASWPSEEPDWASGCYKSAGTCDGPTAAEQLDGFPLSPATDTVDYPWAAGEVGAITQAGPIYGVSEGDGYFDGIAGTPPPEPPGLGGSGVDAPIIQSQYWVTYIFTQRA